jgi:hypothetical protein
VILLAFNVFYRDGAMRRLFFISSKFDYYISTNNYYFKIKDILIKGNNL